MTDLFLLFTLVLFGLVFGSFISALSYRSVRGISILKGRSFCPKCKKQISWYDNIPVVSYLLLGGRSRCCHKRISRRYPLIETSTAFVFFLTGVLILNCKNIASPLCVSHQTFAGAALPYLLFVSLFLITVFITDLENKLIPDNLIFIPYSLALLILIFVNPDYSYTNIFLSFSSATFLLLVHLLTKGKGMGLGDVKLALLPPLILGWPFSVVWLFLSFIIGAVVGVVLILFHKAEFGKQIPFGPFLILSYYLVLFWGDKFVYIFGLSSFLH